MEEKSWRKLSIRRRTNFTKLQPSRILLPPNITAKKTMLRALSVAPRRAARDQGDDGLQLYDGHGHGLCAPKVRSLNAAGFPGCALRYGGARQRKPGFEILGFRSAMGVDDANLSGSPDIEKVAKEDPRHLAALAYPIRAWWLPSPLPSPCLVRFRPHRAPRRRAGRLCHEARDPCRRAPCRRLLRSCL